MPPGLVLVNRTCNNKKYIDFLSALVLFKSNISTVLCSCLPSYLDVRSVIFWLTWPWWPLKRRFYKICFKDAVRSRCFRLPDNFIVLLFQKLQVEMQFRLRLSKEIQTSILQNWFFKKSFPVLTGLVQISFVES